MRNKTAQYRKFTLIELLVMISIIGILAGLILAAVSQARGTARKASCFSNLRQIGQGMIMYVDSFGDSYPFPVITFNGISNHTNGYKMMSWPRYLFGMLGNTELYYCPFDQIKGKRPENPLDNPSYDVSYQYRYCIGFAAEEQFKSPICSSFFRYPSQQVIIHEWTAWHEGEQYTLNRTDTPHDNFILLSSLFIDGHVNSWQMTYYSDSYNCFDANWFGAGNSNWNPRLGLDIVQ